MSDGYLFKIFKKLTCFGDNVKKLLKENDYQSIMSLINI